MTTNNRLFYAVQKAGIAPDGSKTYEVIHGLQTMGVTTTFNLTQIFEIGQLAVYENIEGIPNIEVSLEKVLDGWPPIYMLATQGGTSASLTGRSAVQCMLGVCLYPDTNDQAYGGDTHAEVEMSGMYVGSVGYSVNVNDGARETVSLVGNNKVWIGYFGYSKGTYNHGTHWDGVSDMTENSDRPYAISGSGGVQQREDIIFGSGQTVLPLDIPGIEELDPGSGYNTLDEDGNYKAHVQSISTRSDFGRDELYELGRKGTYHRFVRFPVEVTTEISVIATSGDLVSATEDGLYSEGGSCGRYNLVDRSIKFKLCEGLVVNCGNRNKLSSVGTTGGDASGGNVEITYTYTNFNDLTVTHPKDPSHLS